MRPPCDFTLTNLCVHILNEYRKALGSIAQLSRT